MSDELIKRLREWRNYSQKDLSLEAADRIKALMAEAAKMLAEQDSEYNRKTNAMIERHAEQVKALIAERDALEKLAETRLDLARAEGVWRAEQFARAEAAEAERDRLRSGIDYVLDGYGLKGPHYRFKDRDDGDWISDRLIAALKGESQ